MKTNKRFIPHIAGLKGFAVLLVVLQSFGVYGLSSGFIGIDIFFVISGFLITGALIDEYLKTRDRKTRAGSISLKGFYLRRALRILPAALIVTISTVVFSWVFNDTSRFTGVVKDAIWSTLFSANNNFALQNTDFGLIGPDTSPFQQFWSLAVIVQFCVVWPVLIMVALSLRGLKYQGKRVPWQSRFTAIFLGIALISLAVMVVTFSEQLSLSYFLTSSRMWELSAGALVAMFVRLKESPLRLYNQKYLNYAPIPLLLLSALVVRFDNFAYTLPLVVIAAVILVSKPADSTDLDVKILSVRPLRFIGNISYSLYLWHWPILIFGTELGFADSVPGKILLLLTSFAFASLTYYFVELKFQKITIPTFSRNNSKALSKKLWIASSSSVLLAVIALPSIAAQPVTQSAIANFVTEYQSPKDTLPTQNPVATDDPTDVSGSTNWLSSRQAEIEESNKAIAARGYLTEKQISEIKRVSAGDTYAQGFGFSCSWGDCTLGEPDAKTKVLLLGDSNALMLQSTLTALSKSEKSIYVKSFTSNKCPNVLDPGSVMAKQGFDNESITGCKEIHRAALSYLKNAGQKFDYIILSDLSPDGAVYSDSASLYMVSLKDYGKKTVVLGQVPSAKDLTKCLNADFSNFNSCSGNKHSSIQEYKAATKAGVAFGDISALFCLDNFCPLVIADAPTSSRDHLTDVSAASIAPYFLDFLKDTKVAGK